MVKMVLRMDIMTIYAELFWILSIEIVICGSNIDFLPSFQDQHLDIGKCKAKDGDQYCKKKVQNSYCDQNRNECFCEPGYASIIDNYANGMACKQLLTNQKCDLDKQCTNERDSICHPGQSECICPFGANYVPQKNACREQVDTRKQISIDRSCKECHKRNGRCYYDNSILEQQKKNKSSCLCASNIRSSSTELSNMCDSVAVDVGMYCNNQDVICVSKNSVCKSTDKSPFYPVCQCPSKHVAIYQKNLGIHHCYAQVLIPLDICRKCTNQNGICYDSDGDNYGDACLCTEFRYTPTLADDNTLLNSIDYRARNEAATSDIPCYRDRVSVKCWLNTVEVCYSENPEFQSQFLKFFGNSRDTSQTTFPSPKLIMFVGSDFRVTNSNKRCFLQIDRLKRQTRRLDRPSCLVISNFINKTSHQDNPCQIQVTKYSDGYLYKGYIRLFRDFYENPIKYGVIDFSCPSDQRRKGQQQRRYAGQTIDRSWPNHPNNFEYHFHDDYQDIIDFSVLDIRNKTVQISQNELYTNKYPIKLRAILRINSYNFIAIQMEECSIFQKLTAVKILNEGCPVNSSLVKFPKYFLSTNQFIVQNNRPGSANIKFASGGGYFTNQLETGYFYASIFSEKMMKNERNGLKIGCMFRICRNPNFCQVKPKCGSEQNIHYKDNLGENDILFLQKTFEINFKNQKSSSFVPRTTKQCDGWNCPMEPDRLLILIIIITIVLVIVFLLLLLLYKRQKKAQNTNFPVYTHSHIRAAAASGFNTTVGENGDPTTWKETTTTPTEYSRSVSTTPGSSRIPLSNYYENKTDIVLDRSSLYCDFNLQPHLTFVSPNLCHTDPDKINNLTSLSLSLPKSSTPAPASVNTSTTQSLLNSSHLPPTIDSHYPHNTEYIAVKFPTNSSLTKQSLNSYLTQTIDSNNQLTSSFMQYSKYPHNKNNSNNNNNTQLVS